ncbi:MAG TPA: TIGR04283 family arsenosugar biosynthesis glycosyltransferase [Candidatus Binatia bacterium]|nr:TIGR04283 family arsenosugar biosynthesis glycosyltransferase [Candidatus Binatia bacterium]
MSSDAAAPELSVVIPALDEVHALPQLIEQLHAQEGVTLEIIVADGGSRDGTAQRAEAAGARVVQAPRGRAIQMNQGAATARAPLLLFLHADCGFTSPTQLRDAVRALREVMAHQPRSAGHFGLRFARRSLGHPLFYRYLEEKTVSNRPGTINGDQAMLLPAAWFRELGGFDQRLPFLEDQRFAARIVAHGRWVLLPGRLLTSARRFETEGHYRRYTLMSLIMGMHAAGADEFFAHASRLYASQAETGRLRLSVALGLLRETLAGMGWRRALRTIWRAGRYARQNAWQPFFFCDVALRPLIGPRDPFLAFHDGVFARVTDNVVFDALAALLLAVWFLGVLPLAFTLVDGMRR